MIIDMKNKNIVPCEINFTNWYTSIIKEAKLIEYGSVKGTIFFLPNGWKIWELIKEKIDKNFAKLGIKNVQLPSLIKEKDFIKEKQHVKSFAPEVFMVKSNKEDKLFEPLIIRPTSEIVFCECFKKIINSYNDLPVLFNQWCNVFRMEKNTRPFLRTCEFYWQELHTIHQTEKEAIKQTLQSIEIYKKIIKNDLCMPFIFGEKTLNERFGGAINTYTLESLMQDGQALQCCTSHYLGQNFSKQYDVKFRDKNNELNFVYQTSAGLSTRIIGGIIMTHSDNNGLVLPFTIAPIQIGIIPIKNSDNISLKIKEIEKKLKKKYRIEIANDNNKNLGYKINNFQVQGVPFVILLGEDEIKNNSLTIIWRDLNQKEQIKFDDLNQYLKSNVKNFDQRLYTKAEKHLKKAIVKVNNFKEFEIAIKNNKLVEAAFKQSQENEQKIKILTGATARCIKCKAKPNSKCFLTNEQATDIVYFARAY